MPKVNKDVPKEIKPYIFHGVDLDWENEDNPRGECPWCGKEKFAVSVETGFARCLVCGIAEDGKSGVNPTSFIRLLYKRYKEQPVRASTWNKLSEERGIKVQTLKQFGLAHDGAHWHVPGYNTKGKICQLYRRGKQFFPTPTLGAKMFGWKMFKGSKCLNIFEGIWDQMRYYEVMRELGRKESSISIPGALVFQESWASYFSKNFDVINLFQDNDHPRTADGRTISGAGTQAVNRIADIFSAASFKGAFNAIQWGNDCLYNEELPNGTDVRDVLNNVVELQS